MFKYFFKNKKLDKSLIDLESNYDNLINAIDSFLNDNQQPINRDQLSSFPLMVWKDIGNGISIRRKKNRFGNYLNFDTKMECGAEFGEHFHDDMIESCEVIEGELFDQLTNKYYEVGDVAHYEKGEKHKPIATKPTFLHVLFK
jgi:anti-sigma factor ChrR (cupin superfamily)